MMEYKGYLGDAQLDTDAGLFHGQVLGIKDVVTFQGSSVVELQQAFHDSIDDYLAFCEERGEEPDKPFSGRFIVRVEPDLHRAISKSAAAAGMSLNAWVEEQLASSVPIPLRSGETKAPPRKARKSTPTTDKVDATPKKRVSQPTTKKKKQVVAPSPQEQVGQEQVG